MPFATFRASGVEFESLGSADLIVDAVYEGKDSRLASEPDRDGSTPAAEIWAASFQMINMKKLLTLTFAFAAALSAKAQLYEVSSLYVPMHENLAPSTEEHIGNGVPIVLDRFIAELGAEFFNATGRPRGSLPDCLIAATAVSQDAILVSLDDFRAFESLGLKFGQVEKTRM
jgi:predicted nucleic acid-binding protein